MTAERLSARNTEVGYDRTTPPSIAHLGVGAFARAHLAVYADDLLRAGHPAMIRGVSLRSRSAEDQLGPQDGLFTVDEREPGQAPKLQVVGSLASVGTGVDAAVEAIGAPTTTLVTLTVTEKGYATGEAPAVVTKGLAQRDRRLTPPVVASLDNVAHNGALLRARVLEAAERDGDLARWIADEVRFPNSVVDRMVPATTAADLDEVEGRLGFRDEAAVVAEHHCSWVIEGVDALPPLGDVGVEVVADVAPYQQRKLWLLNGPHSALAYGGLLGGCETIADAAQDPTVSAFVIGLVADILEVCAAPDALAFSDDALRRFANPALGHTCAQVGADGSQKLTQRLLPVAVARRQRGLPTDRLAVVVALWRHALESDQVEDPSSRLAGAVDRSFLAEVEATLDRVRDKGPAVLRAEP